MIDKRFAGIDRRKPIPGCQPENEIAMAIHRRARSCNQTSIWRASKFRHAALDLAGIAGANRNDVGTDRTCHRLNYCKLPDAGGHSRVSNDPDADGCWRHLLERSGYFSVATYVGSGSIATEMGCPRDVRFPPISD